MHTDTRHLIMRLLALLMPAVAATGAAAQERTWPDGTRMGRWFADTAKIDPDTLGRKYVITDYGVTADSTAVQTERIQTRPGPGAAAWW